MTGKTALEFETMILSLARETISDSVCGTRRVVIAIPGYSSGVGFSWNRDKGRATVEAYRLAERGLARQWVAK